MTWLGVVADDVTGACDLAGVVTAAGLPATVLLGPPQPDDEPAPGAECAVVALASRTAPADDAVAWSVAAGRWLLDHGAQRLYQKYCSTFDSTKDGTIGPVADALADLTGTGSSVGTPATPAVGRTVYQGHLFVDGRLLSESPLRDHPLTPMTDPDLARVLGAQTPRPVAVVPWPAFGGRADATASVRRRVAAAAGGHVLLDAITDADLVHAATLFEGDELLGGASGLAAGLARRYATLTGRAPGSGPSPLPAVDTGGGRVVLAGSCSRRTREQIAAFGGPMVRIGVDDLAADPTRTVSAAVAAALTALRSAADRPVLVTTSLDPQELRRVQERHGRDRSARLAEDALADVARTLAEAGVRRLIVAGGETSGAVTRALGVRQVVIGDQVAPGVPWTVSAGPLRLALLLKSGNFGPADLFTTAWEVAP